METLYKGLGRRKSSTAIAKVTAGTGKILVNKQTLEQYFVNPLLVQDIKRPLEVVNSLTNYDINIVVNGGGFSGQAGAIRLSIARALVQLNPEFKKPLKQEKLMTRDARCKERKKFGKYGARRSPQFTKR